VYFSKDKKHIVEKIKAWVVVAEAECQEYGKGESLEQYDLIVEGSFLNKAILRLSSWAHARRSGRRGFAGCTGVGQGPGLHWEKVWVSVAQMLAARAGTVCTAS